MYKKFLNELSLAYIHIWMHRYIYMFTIQIHNDF